MFSQINEFEFLFFTEFFFWVLFLELIFLNRFFRTQGTFSFTFLTTWERSLRLIYFTCRKSLAQNEHSLNVMKIKSVVTSEHLKVAVGDFFY